MAQVLKRNTKIIILFSLFLFYFIYSFIIYTTATAKPENMLQMSDEAIRGKELWHRNNCISCHQIYGLGGYMGPDLTNVISSKGEAYATALIKVGGRAMPAYNFSEKDTEAIIEYLKYIDQTGTSPVRDFKFTWYGSFKLKN